MSPAKRLRLKAERQKAQDLESLARGVHQVKTVSATMADHPGRNVSPVTANLAVMADRTPYRSVDLTADFNRVIEGREGKGE